MQRINQQKTASMSDGLRPLMHEKKNSQVWWHARDPRIWEAGQEGNKFYTVSLRLAWTTVCPCPKTNKQKKQEISETHKWSLTLRRQKFNLSNKVIFLMWQNNIFYDSMILRLQLAFQQIFVKC